MASQAPFTSPSVDNREEDQSLQQNLSSNQAPAIDHSSDDHVNHPPFSSESASLSQVLSDILRRDMDQLLQFEIEQLRLTLLQQVNNQILTVISRVERNVAVLLRSKDDDMAKMKNELEKNVSMLLGMKEDELAKLRRGYQELLNDHQEVLRKLERTEEKTDLLRETSNDASFGRRIPKELLSCSCSDKNVPLGGEKGYTVSCSSGQARDASRFVKVLSPCNACGSAVKSMILLPCRHLCACKKCAASLVACPVCNCSSTGYLEVLLD